MKRRIHIEIFNYNSFLFETKSKVHNSSREYCPYGHCSNDMGPIPATNNLDGQLASSSADSSTFIEHDMTETSDTDHTKDSSRVTGANIFSRKLFSSSDKSIPNSTENFLSFEYVDHEVPMEGEYVDHEVPMDGELSNECQWQ